ncbi:DUF6790 family protein [Halomicroarcula sp. GCM10025324]|uniref:DUF6790 family protein n=1 Tax=Haloarcula TaxID=2237 RepID=UPI0023E823CB|nr:DUF6790 family protein [Halomicroarcula sp. ZS-22-S1]
MEDVFLIRIFAYTVLPLIFAVAHLLVGPQSRTFSRRIELFVIYLLAISVGANGISGAFGHLFLSDLVAESVGWPAGSPFQLEMGFANLALGVLGFLAVGRRGGFRIATIIAVAIIGFGATTVHLLDIAATGNLAPGNTIQNVSNVTDPVLLIGLTWLSARRADPDAESSEFERWQQRQQPIAMLAAAGIGTGFGIGFAMGGLLLWTVVGAAVGLAIGVRFSRRLPDVVP